MVGSNDGPALARRIIDLNRYMTIASADSQGRPWASPVFYAQSAYEDFYWISSPDALHSRNLVVRPEIAMVVFDSTIPVGEGQAVYLMALARELAPPEDETALRFYPGPPSRGGKRLKAHEIRAPSLCRIYRASVTAASILCRSEGASQPCSRHGRSFDHREVVDLKLG